MQKFFNIQCSWKYANMHCPTDHTKKILFQDKSYTSAQGYEHKKIEEEPNLLQLQVGIKTGIPSARDQIREIKLC